MRTSTHIVAGLLLLSVSAGGAVAQSVNTEKGPISHPTAAQGADPRQGSEKGPISHPTTAQQGSEKGPVSHPTAADGSEKGPVSHPTAASDKKPK
jgi:hypothetical protein